MADDGPMQSALAENDASLDKGVGSLVLVGVGGVDSSIQEDARLLAETVMMFRQCASAERNIKNSERDRDGARTATA